MDGQSPGHDPKMGHGITRRRFLRDTAVATGGAVALGVAAGAPASVAEQATAPAAAAPGAGGAAVATGGYTPVALSPEEYTTLRAILARLIPADELGPGAVEAGVDVFIDRSLSAAYAQSLPEYTQNLEALNTEALKQGGVFAALSTDQ